MKQCFVIGFLLDIVVALPRLRQVAVGGLFNPDSYMRLVRLREIVAAQAPLHGVARDASGLGTRLPWSHLLDSLLLVAAVPLRPWMDAEDAWRWAGVALGPVGMGLLCAGIAWAFQPMTDPRWRWTTPVLAATSLPIAGYGMPGVVHHHILVALACVMTAGFCGRALWRGVSAGVQAGVWAAVGLWLSPETMPFTLMSFAALGVAWATRGPGSPAGRAFRAAGSMLAVLVVAIVAVDPPAGGRLAVEIDRISIVYVGLAAILAGLGWLLPALDAAGLSPRRRAVAAAAAAGLLLGLWIACCPSVALGPNGLLSREQTSAMFGGIAEMQPIADLRAGAELIATGALGAAVVIMLALRRRTVLWAYAATCCVAVVVLGVLHLRFSTYAAVLGAGVLPVAITLSGQRLADWPRRVRSLDRLALLALFLLTPLTGRLGPAQASGGASGGGAGCSVASALPLLAPYARQVVLADVNDTPELLYRTGVLTVGSLYHTNAPAFMRLRAAWRSRESPPEPEAVLAAHEPEAVPAAREPEAVHSAPKPEAVPSAPEQEARSSPAEPEAVRATGAAAILVCPGGPRSAIVADLPPDTLLDRLDRGDPPGWLQAAGSDLGGHVLYRVVP